MSASISPTSSRGLNSFTALIAPVPEAPPETSAPAYRHDPVPWIEGHFRTQVPGGLITLVPIQAAVLRFMFQPPLEPTDPRPFRFGDLHYSTIKKSGKTAIAAAVCQWAAEDDETWGGYGEVYSIANDLEQAHGRVFRAITASIAQDPVVISREGDWRPRFPEILAARSIRNLRTGTTIAPVSGNYAGAAGGNPTLTAFSELWGYRLEASRRLWSEMKPSPVRPRSVRFVETYRGFRGESTLLEEREATAMERGRQVTAGELSECTGCALGVFPEAPNHDSLVPLWVNERAGMCAYIDYGADARRMPWQVGEAGDRYYAEQQESETPGEFDRHHRNLWGEPQTTAIPIEWWDACLDELPALPDDPRGPPVVVALDAGVSHDGFAFQAVSRHPDPALKGTHIVQRAAMLWEPLPGQVIDFGDEEAPGLGTPRGFLRDFCARRNVVQVGYDRHELHSFVTHERKRGYAWFRDFPQGDDRLLADRGLYQLVRDRQIHHLGDDATRAHVRNCAAKVPKDDDSRMRLVKLTPDGLIDLAVALSMASHECLRLNLG